MKLRQRQNCKCARVRSKTNVQGPECRFALKKLSKHVAKGSGSRSSAALRTIRTSQQQACRTRLGWRESPTLCEIRIGNATLRNVGPPRQGGRRSSSRTMSHSALAAFAGPNRTRRRPGGAFVDKNQRKHVRLSTFKQRQDTSTFSNGLACLVEKTPSVHPKDSCNTSAQQLRAASSGTRAKTAVTLKRESLLPRSLDNVLCDEVKAYKGAGSSAHSQRRGVNACTRHGDSAGIVVKVDVSSSGAQETSTRHRARAKERY